MTYTGCVQFMGAGPECVHSVFIARVHWLLYVTGVTRSLVCSWRLVHGTRSVRLVLQTLSRVPLYVVA